MKKQESKIVCLVLEGIGKQLLDRYMEKGYLPNLHNLLRGQGGNLLSTRVPYEGSALHTAFTGYSPEESGVFSYWHIHNHDYIPRIIDSSEFRYKTIWQREEFADMKFAVINIFGTYKPYPINGYMLSYLFQNTLNAGYPKNLLRELSKEKLSYSNDVLALYKGTERDKFLDMVFKLENKRINVALNLLEKVDFLIANFTIVDRVSHFYTQELDSELYTDETETAIFKAYELVDQAIGKFIERVDDDSQLLIFSELGFGTLLEYVSINNYLQKAGYLVKSADGKIDWKKTIAFETIQGSHGININLTGLYRDGWINTEDFEKRRAEVINYLTNLINPKTGMNFFKGVYKGEDFYPGSRCKDAPHIMLEPLDYRYLPLGDNYWADRVYRHYQSGWHRRDGFWTGKGKKINGIYKDGSILDICPTLFTLADKSVPKEFVGTSLV